MAKQMTVSSGLVADTTTIDTKPEYTPEQLKEFRENGLAAFRIVRDGPGKAGSMRQYATAVNQLVDSIDSGALARETLNVDGVNFSFVRACRAIFGEKVGISVAAIRKAAKAV